MLLESVWFVLWGVLWAVYFMLDGFDLGLGTLLPFLGKTEAEKRIIYNSAGPFWDGNEVWLITAGGVTFAAFPATYAVMFSALYTPLMLILFALILRGVSFEFRSHFEGAGWRRLWDFCHVVGSFLPALLLGVAFANIFRGLTLTKAGVIEGGLLSLLNWYGLLGGLLFVVMFMCHGAIWLAVKSEGELQIRAALYARRLWAALLVLAVAFLVATAFATPLYDNYLGLWFLFAIPLLAVAGLLAARLFMARGAWWRAWFSSGLFIMAATMFGVVGLYPNLLPSRLDPAASMTIKNSASSPLTLQIMLGVALVFVPVVILYQAWVYRLFSDKVTTAKIADEGWY